MSRQWSGGEVGGGNPEVRGGSLWVPLGSLCSSLCSGCFSRENSTKLANSTEVTSNEEIDSINTSFIFHWNIILSSIGLWIGKPWIITVRTLAFLLKKQETLIFLIFGKIYNFEFDSALIVHSPCNATTSQVCCKEMNNSDQLIGFPSFKVKHQVTGVSQKPLYLD